MLRVALQQILPMALLAVLIGCSASPPAKPLTSNPTARIKQDEVLNAWLELRDIDIEDERKIAF